MSTFSLIPGVYIPDVSALKREYKQGKSRLMFSLSARDYKRFFEASVKLLREPVFFFVEIPGDNDCDRTYYLDNCTSAVAQAILKRYSDILFSDGVIKFGFGSHSTEDEIYMQEYQTVSICAKNTAEYAKILENLGYTRNDKAVLAWDILSESNTGECVNVEANDEGYPEMINNLIDVGMYCANDC